MIKPKSDNLKVKSVSNKNINVGTSGSASGSPVEGAGINKNHLIKKRIQNKKKEASAIQKGNNPELKIQCRKCLNILNKRYFYSTTNPSLDTSGYIPVCKSCSRIIFDGYVFAYEDEEKALYEICRDLDIAYFREIYILAQDKVNKTREKTMNGADVYSIYKGFLTGLMRDKVNGLFRFKDSDNYLSKDELDKIAKDSPLLKKTKLGKPPEELIIYWGSGRTPEDYRYLENEKAKILGSFMCEDYGAEMLQRDICIINLEIEKERKLGRDVQKLIDTRSKLMNDAKMKPIQATGTDGGGGQLTYGQLISKLENEKPIPQRIDNEMKEAIDIITAHLMKMEDRQNDFTAKIDRDLDEFTIDVDTILKNLTNEDGDIIKDEEDDFDNMDDDFDNMDDGKFMED